MSFVMTEKTAENPALADRCRVSEATSRCKGTGCRYGSSLVRVVYEKEEMKKNSCDAKWIYHPPGGAVHV